MAYNHPPSFPSASGGGAAVSSFSRPVGGAPFGNELRQQQRIYQLPAKAPDAPGPGNMAPRYHSRNEEISRSIHRMKKHIEEHMRNFLQIDSM